MEARLIPINSQSSEQQSWAQFSFCVHFACGEQFMCFTGWGFPQSSHEVILQSDWNVGIAVLITEGHCQDSQTLFSFSCPHYTSLLELTDLSALFQHNLHLLRECSWALFHQSHLLVPPRPCWADEQAREEGAGMWNKDPGEGWNDEDTEQNEGQAAEGILGAAPDPRPDEYLVAQLNEFSVWDWESSPSLFKGC